MSADPAQVELEGESGHRLRGVTEGSGPPIVLLHGLTAHRDLVVHGSRALARGGYELTRYDARGHGESEGTGEGTYTYDALSADLSKVLDDRFGPTARVVAAGHSMGAHTLLRQALDAPDRFAGLVVIGPVATGEPPSDRALEHWDSLGRGLSESGIDGFLAALDDGLDPAWRDVVLRIAGERMRRHRDLGAVARALRELPRSQPIDSLEELSALDVPTLVVASHDEADPGHPYATAAAYAEAIPGAELISEGEGESPLAWQGGKLSREIASFCERIGVPGGA